MCRITGPPLEATCAICLPEGWSLTCPLGQAALVAHPWWRALGFIWGALAGRQGDCQSRSSARSSGCSGMVFRTGLEQPSRATANTSPSSRVHVLGATVRAVLAGCGYCDFKESADEELGVGGGPARRCGA